MQKESFCLLHEQAHCSQVENIYISPSDHISDCSQGIS